VESFRQEQINSDNYITRTPSYYLDKISPDILASFTNEQLRVITSLLERAIPKSSPKIVDFRFTVDLIFSRFYVVLFVGKDRRRKQRHQVTEGIARIGNAIAAVILLLAANLVISALILLFAYLFKSAIGLNFFPGHISESFKKL
jgi:hypothetical protein